MWRTFAYFLTLAGMVSAEGLPQINDEPWVGWYFGQNTRKYRMGININGILHIQPIKKNSPDIISRERHFQMEPRVEEITSSGKRVNKKIDQEAWEGVTEPAMGEKKMVFRGTVSGGAKFEVTFEPTRDGYTAGGRILDKGSITNPLQFSLRCNLPRPYTYQTDASKAQKSARKDRYEFVQLDGKKVRLTGDKKADTSGPEVTATGLREATIALNVMNTMVNTVTLDAGTEGSLRVENVSSKEQELYHGLYLFWTPKAAEGTAGEARLTVTWK